MTSKRSTVVSRMLTTIVGMVVLASSSWVYAEETSVTPPMREKETNNRLSIENIQRFSTAISQIKNYYVKNVDDSELFDDAIRGMLSGLDPHSAYLDPEEFKDLTETTRGEFGGLGIEVTIEKGLLRVIAPLEDTPAQKVGIKSGDYIIRIDDVPIQELTLRQAVNMIRGKLGTKVKLMILRKGETKPLSFTVTRETIQIKTVKSKLYDGKLGYLRITHFQSPTYSKVLEAIAELKKESKGNLSGIVIDLRDNPGGLLDSAIEISDAFIHNNSVGPEEMIVYTKGRVVGSDFTALAHPGDVLNKKPIVVLINGGSASASEIVAGAIQDNDRGIIVGERSFGKGSVQTVIPLDDKSGIKLTTALYYTPDGRSIQAKGIVPDIEINSIVIPKTEKSESIPNLTEADLRGHLDNANAKTNDKSIMTTANEKTSELHSKDLINSDYQLHEAFNILKSLVYMKKTKV